MFVDTAKVQVPLWERDHDFGFSEGRVDLRLQVVDDHQSTADLVEKLCCEQPSQALRTNVFFGLPVTLDDRRESGAFFRTLNTGVNDLVHSSITGIQMEP